MAPYGHAATRIESDDDARRRLQEEYDYYFARRDHRATSLPSPRHHSSAPHDTDAMTFPYMVNRPSSSPHSRTDDDLLVMTQRRRKESSIIAPESPPPSFASAASAESPFSDRRHLNSNDFQTNCSRDVHEPSVNKFLREDLARISPTNSDEDNTDEECHRQLRYHQSLIQNTSTSYYNTGDARFYERNAPPRMHDPSEMMYPPDLYQQNQHSLNGGGGDRARSHMSSLAHQSYPRLSMSQRSLSSRKKPPPQTNQKLKAPPQKSPSPLSGFSSGGRAVAVTKSPAPKMIELSPGVHVLFRGADETWRAVQIDFYTPCHCFGCAADPSAEPIFCIQDADFVICPICKTVSPLDDINDAAKERHRSGGAGLGFTMATLAEMQAEAFRAIVS